ncbi:MAG: hypothetical protein H0S84_13070 [Bacteroidales bacterium]|jgi:hypothetical protein|nr:hypothetical protein [Bacteroidales bacterium]MDN5350744.1 hypothetical protein [Bacteroidales bacterium]
MSQPNESISRIREIVLGNNIAEIENRFLKLDQQFTFMLDEAETKWSKQLQNLDEKSSEALKKSITEISKEHQKQFDLLKSELESNSKMLQNLITGLEGLRKEVDQLQEKQQLIKQEFDNRFNTELAATKKQWTEKLADLQVNKIDRSAMAVLLSELALSLSDKSDSKKSE